MPLAWMQPVLLGIAQVVRHIDGAGQKAEEERRRDGAHQLRRLGQLQREHNRQQNRAILGPLTGPQAARDERQLLEWRGARLACAGRRHTPIPRRRPKRRTTSDRASATSSPPSSIIAAMYAPPPSASPPTTYVASANAPTGSGTAH